MFSLIITIISIVLVAALALATLYFGGSSWTRGSATANSAQLANQGQQILGALTLYYTEHGAYPAVLNDLVASAYLKTIPVPPTSAQSPSVLEWAAAADESWEMLAAGEPAAMVREAVSQDVCQELNYRLLGSDAVREKADPSVMAQCFGNVSGPYTFIVGVPEGTNTRASLKTALENYNAAHADTPLKTVTVDSPSNPVTVAQTRTNGSPVLGPAAPIPSTSLVLGPLSREASTSTGTGGALLQGAMFLNIDETTSVPLTLQRLVSAENLARYARIGLPALTPSGALLAVYADVRYQAGTFETTLQSPYQPQGCWKEVTGTKCWQPDAYCAYWNDVTGGTDDIAARVTGPVQDGGLLRWGCAEDFGTAIGDRSAIYLSSTDRCADGLFHDGTSCVTPPWVASSEEDAQTRILSNLQTSPAVAGEAVDAIAAIVPVEQALPGPVTITGPVSVDGGTTGTTTSVYELNYSNEWVTVTETATTQPGDQTSISSATAQVLWP